MTDLVENEQLPAWLVELRDQQIQDQSEPSSPPVVEEAPVEMAPASVAEDLRLQMIREQEELAQAEAQTPFVEGEGQTEADSPIDLLDDLREQMILEDDVFEDEQRTSSTLSVAGLQPVQRLLLAVLLFMNVAVCGCMMLIMAGRVELPF